jgi:diacylglycerol kinase
MTNKQNQNIHFARKRIKSFKYALRGIIELLKTESNARIHVILAALIIFVCIYLDISSIEWCIIIICIGMVLAAEAFNTSIEKMADHVNPKFHPRIKRIKDLAAAGVLFSALSAAIIGFIIILPKVFALTGWFQ